MRHEDELSPDERLSEVAHILAAGVLRLKERLESSAPALDHCSETVLSVPRG